jgi:TolA-binding protein
MRYAAGDIQAALELYERLETLAENPVQQTEALIGQMRCHNRLGNLPSAAGAAQRLMASGQGSEAAVSEARLILGKNYLASNDLTLAEVEFNALARLNGTESGAEANYSLAWIDFSKGNLQAAEDRIYSLAENFSAFDYWVAKGFILLSDIFVRNGNEFQARETLQSVIDNYEGPELGETARQKLQELIN